MTAPLLVCRGLRIAYGTRETRVEALAGVDLELNGGEAIALLGRSGSGKSTLLHALGGLVEPEAGTVEWEGLPLLSLDASARADARARGIAYVFQGANLLPYFTAAENVAFAASVRGDECGSQLEPSAFLRLVGLVGKIDSLPAELSGGEAQRVAIARALAQAPRLLLCDEPTGHLDSDTGRRVLDLLDRAQELFRFALVVATHDPDVAARYERAVELHDGRVVRPEMLT